MTSNKIIFDTFYPHQDNGDGPVIIVLKDAKIYTIVPRNVLLARNMDCGCFIEHTSHDTPQQSKAAAMRLAHAIGAQHVSPEEFIEIEQRQQTQRVAKAFATAEAMIARG